MLCGILNLKYNLLVIKIIFVCHGANLLTCKMVGGHKQGLWRTGRTKTGFREFCLHEY